MHTKGKYNLILPHVTKIITADSLKASNIVTVTNTMISIYSKIFTEAPLCAVGNFLLPGKERTGEALDVTGPPASGGGRNRPINRVSRAIKFRCGFPQPWKSNLDNVLAESTGCVSILLTQSEPLSFIPDDSIDRKICLQVLT